MNLFVDTSVWYAAVDAGDCGNPRAREVLAQGKRLVTSDHVLVESWSLLQLRLSRHAAERFWSELRNGVAIIEQATPADLEEAWAIGRRFPDQDFSIVDRTSFAMMQRLGIIRVASFDDDFAIFRYGRGLRKAFEVVR